MTEDELKALLVQCLERGVFDWEYHENGNVKWYECPACGTEYSEQDFYWGPNEHAEDCPLAALRSEVASWEKNDGETA